jgi:hypothetical protein
MTIYMDILKEIQTGFANLADTGRMKPIDGLSANEAAYVFREDRYFGVAVELSDGPIVSEGFAGARLVTVSREINNSVRKFLRLESSIYALRNEFAVVCAQMVAPGIGGAKRAELVANPLAWWERWRHLLGNAVVSRTSYAVLAEMLAVERLIARGEKIDWQGPLGGTIDIITPSMGFEVKSTVSRYDSRIKIAGQFQLALSESRPLKILHFRFEPTSSGDSVNSVAQRLVDAGFTVDRLEDLLTQCGLEEGCSARTETFTTLEARSFPVSEDFPRITAASFVGGVLPLGIEHIEYQVDLSGLINQPF